MSIKFATNLDTLVEHIGAYQGMADAIESPKYLSDLMTNAHRLTVPDFVKAAAAAAKEDNFTHMYEYGVRGLTRGDSTTINPLSQRARLWKDVMVGNGSRKLITFVYRNATQRVPKHTTEETGVAQDELNKLQLNQGKKYVFSHKAEIFEQGIDLNIHPKQREGVLFVPLRNSGITGTARDQTRGYTWRKKLHINPGKLEGADGQFSFFFYNWWGRAGNNLMITRMDKQVTADIKRTEATLPKRGTLKSPRSINVPADAAVARAKYRKQFTMWVRREAGEREVTGY
jgi:hypothetical protein